MELEGLSVVCAGLGCASEDTNGRRNGYIKSDNCLENLKDLQRFLRRDHPQTRDVFKQLGKWNTMSQDLIPIIEHYRDEPETIINTVKVVVFLTMPIDPSSDDVSLQMEYLWSFKELFSRNDSIAVIVSLLEEPLERLECGAFTEDDWKVIQLVFTLFRNLLAVQDPSPQQTMGRSTSQFAFLRDAFLEHLFHENVMDLLLALTQHISGLHSFLKQDNLLLLEIYHYIFWGQRPELVASAQQMNSKKDNKLHHSSRVLQSMMEEEEEQRRLSRLRDLPRHSLFCGTFVRLAPDGSKRIVKRNPFVTPAESILKTHQIKRGPVKRIACDTVIPLSSKESVLRLLQNFAEQFLDASYNVLMQSVREDIRREHQAIQNSDIIVFFEVAHFFTAYQRCRIANRKGKSDNAEFDKYDEKGNNDTLFRGLICGPLASTMNEAMFNMVISKWHYSFEALKETKDLKTLTTAGALIKEMIHMLDLVLKISCNGLKETEQEARTARILLYKVFYDHTEKGITHFLLTLIKSFDIHKQPRSHLTDLVEMTHIVLRLMEAVKEADGTLRVLKKSRKGRKKKKMVGDQQEHVPVQSSDNGVLTNARGDASERLSDPNEQIAVETEKFNEEGSNTEVHKDNVEEDMRVSKSDDDGRVQHKSSLENLDECEEEIEFLEKNIENEAMNLLDDGESNSEDDDQGRRVEADFDIPKFISSFADNTIVRNYCWLLIFYKSNSAATNHYIIRMLQRICDDCMLAPMLYQLSLFSMFYEILSDQRTLQSEEYKNIVQFLTKLLREFFKKLKDHPFLFVEILFWKTRRECNSISTDRLLSEMNKWKNKGDDSMQKNTADTLGDDEADGINKSQITEGPYKKNVADALGDDEADIPLGEFDKHEKEILTKEKIRRSPKKRKGSIFSEEQEAQIIELFEKYKENRRCSFMIAEVLDPNGKYSAAQVSRKLKQLGLKIASGKRKSGIDKFLNDENDETEEDIQDTPSSAEVTGKTSRKRLFLVSEDESDNETQQNDSMKAPEKQKSPIKGKNEKSPKKKKRFVFSEKEEGLIMELYEQHKEIRNCSQLIAESLDLPVAQVNLKLKLLGLKATSRKTKTRVKRSSTEGDETAVGLQDEDDLNEAPLKTKLKTSDKKKSLIKDRNVKSPKKRKSYVFSEEQEGLMKELFEQNRENRQCSHLIAEALGLSVAQVNRKLKLLGLKVTLKKQKSEIVEQASVKFADNTAGVGDEDDSDHEPLMSILSKSQKIRQQKRNVTEALDAYLKKSGIVEHHSDKDDKIASGRKDEGDSDDEPLTSRLKRSQNSRQQTRKVTEALDTSLKKSEIVEHYTHMDDKIASGRAGEDESDDEPLTSGLKRSQNIKLQKRKVPEVCNEPVKKSGITEYCWEKDEETVPVVGVEDDSDDELLVSKLVRSPNMRVPKGKMAEAYDKPVKNFKTASREAAEDYTENETLLTHLLKKTGRTLERSKDRNLENRKPTDKLPDNEVTKDLQPMGTLKKCLSNESGKAGGVKVADQSLVDLSDNLKESLLRSKDYNSIFNKKVFAKMLDDSNLLEENMEEDNVEENLSEGKHTDSLVNEESVTELLEDTTLLEDDLLEDILEETSSQGKDNDSLFNLEAGTKMLEDTNLLEDDMEEDGLEEKLSKSKDNDSPVDGEADLEMLEDRSLS
ncbi:hypothetical protein KI387_035789, partial [Taxus chinensis]